MPDVAVASAHRRHSLQLSTSSAARRTNREAVAKRLADPCNDVRGQHGVVRGGGDYLPLKPPTSRSEPTARDLPEADSLARWQAPWRHRTFSDMRRTNRQGYEAGVDI